MGQIESARTTPVGLEARPLIRVRFAVAPTAEIGLQGGSIRSLHYFTGGSFDGRISGIVLPGGGDKALVRTPDWVEIDAYAALQTDSGANIFLAYQGLWRAKPGAIQQALEAADGASFNDDDHYLRTTARFEAGGPEYSWLNGVIAVGRGKKCEGGIEHSFYEVA